MEWKNKKLLWKKFNIWRYNLNGKITGKGKEYYDNGKISFEGEYLNGKRNGKG